MQTTCGDSIQTFINDVTKLAGGLPDSKMFLEGLNVDTVSMPSLVTLYSKTVKEGKLTQEFAKSMKSQIDTVVKDACGIRL